MADLVLPTATRARLPLLGAQRNTAAPMIHARYWVPDRAWQSALLWRTATSESHSFIGFFAYAFGLLFIFNLVDLLLLDWLILCWMEPWWVILPGTEHIVLPKQYFHHFEGFLLGTAGLAFVSFAIAAFLSGRSI